MSYLQEGKTILELGSGYGSKLLSDSGYKVIAVEHDEKWLGLFEDYVIYIYAPLKEHKAVRGFNKRIWYDPAPLQNLPHHDLIVVDGPPKPVGRAGFLKYLDLFNQDVPIIIDDVNRISECFLLQRVATRLQRPYYVDTTRGKLGHISTYGVILPNGWGWVPVKGG